MFFVIVDYILYLAGFLGHWELMQNQMCISSYFTFYWESSVCLMLLNAIIMLDTTATYYFPFLINFRPFPSNNICNLIIIFTTSEPRIIYLTAYLCYKMRLKVNLICISPSRIIPTTLPTILVSHLELKLSVRSSIIYKKIWLTRIQTPKLWTLQLWPQWWGLAIFKCCTEHR